MTTFEVLGLEERLVKAISELGFETPTPIQEKGIPVLLSGTKDFVGLAQTGTGKTAAFGLPLLQLISAEKKYPQALVVCPTRELCMQIVNEIELFKKHIRGVHVVAVYGGASMGAQIRDIKRGVQIAVATPGRLIDLIERKAINLEQISYVVLDEADEMLNMGFQEDIEFILQNTPKRESTWLFSATMPNEIRRVSKRYMKEPVEITVGAMNTANLNIDHQYFVTGAQYRYQALKRLIDFNPGIYGIIFTRTKADAQEIAEKLTREGYDIDALHGDLTQQQRDKVMGEFREKTLQLLIATDVAARGIDVQGITHVINYESYVPMLEEKFASVSKEEVLKRVAALEFDRFLKYYENAEDLNVREVRRERTERIGVSNGRKGFERPVHRDTKGRSFGNGDYTKLFVNLGTKDGFYKASFLQFILDMSDLRKEVLGKIDMKEMNSWIEVDKKSARQMITAIDGKNYRGRRIRMNEANR